MLKKNSEYENIYFSGSGIMCVYQIGCVMSLLINKIKFKNIYASSAGIIPAMLLCNENVTVNDIGRTYQMCIFYIKNIYNKKLIDLCVMRKILSDTYDTCNVSLYLNKIKIGVRQTNLKSVWLDDFKSKNDFLDCCMCAISLFPYLMPYKYKKKYYIDQMTFTEYENMFTYNIHFNLCISPFNYVMMPRSDITIHGRAVKNIKNFFQIIFASEEKMYDEFLCGADDTCNKISDYLPYKINIDQYTYQIHANYKKSEVGIMRWMCVFTILTLFFLSNLKRIFNSNPKGV